MGTTNTKAMISKKMMANTKVITNTKMMTLKDTNTSDED